MIMKNIFYENVHFEQKLFEKIIAFEMASDVARALSNWKLIMLTLDSGIDVAPGINIAYETFGKIIKRALKIGIPHTIR